MLKLTDNYAIEFDYQNSVSLYKWEDSKEFTKGKDKGKMSEAGWKLMSKYFSGIKYAVKYVADLESQDASDLKEFIEKYDEITRGMVMMLQDMDLKALQEP